MMHSQAGSDVSAGTAVPEAQSCTVRWMRNFIYVLAIVAAATAGWLEYTRERTAQNRAFEADLSSLLVAVRRRMSDTFANAEFLANGTADAFPYPPGGQAYFPRFSAYATSVMNAVDAVSIMMGPQITQRDRPGLDAFLAARASTIVDSRTDLSAPEKAYMRGRLAVGISALQVVNGSMTLVPYSTLPAPTSNASLQSRVSPLSQVEPMSPFITVYLIDVATDPTRAALVDYVFYTRTTTWMNLALLARRRAQLSLRARADGSGMARGSAFRNSLTRRDPCTPPSSSRVQPAATVEEGLLTSAATTPSFWVNPETGGRDVTGMSTITVSWVKMLSRAFERRHTLDVIITELLANDFGWFYAPSGLAFVNTSSYTMRVEGGKLRQVGPGDRRSSDGCGWARSFELHLGPLSAVRIEIVPAKSYILQFVNSRPYDGMGVAVAIVAFIAIVFAVFDYVHSNHVRAVSLRFAMQRFADKLDREGLQQRTLFARMVAHEIRTPASSICGALDLFRTTGVSAQQRQFLDIVSSGAEHILTLVEDMMAAGTEDGAPDDGSAETQFRLTPVRVDPLREIVQEAWDSTCLQKRYAGKVKALRLQLEVASNIPRVAFLDAGRARQVIANLVGNSLKFTGPGGSVTVVAEFIEEERQLSVRVVDTGRGLSAEGLARLFKPFSQAEGAETKRRFGGTGLGLCISRDICQALGGDLRLESEGLDRGCVATATFLLPDYEGPHTRTPSGSLHASQVAASQTGTSQPTQQARHSQTKSLPAPPAGKSWTLSNSAVIPLEGEQERPQPQPQPTKRSVSFRIVRSVKEKAKNVARGWTLRQNPLAEESQGSHSPDGSSHQLDVPSPVQSHKSSVGAGVARRESAPHSVGKSLPRKSGEHVIKTPPSHTVVSLPSPQPPPSPLIRVVAAEDDGMCRRVLGMLLRSAKYDCIGLVSDGVQVTDFLTKGLSSDAKGGKNLPQILILDANMGGGEKDGLPTLIRIRQIYSQAGLAPPPVVFLSGESDPRDHARFVAAGATKVIVKPASLENLSSLRNLVVAAEFNDQLL